MVENKEEKEGISLKEERIRRILQAYYSRQDIRKAIADFSKNREVVPRYFEGFGKRPDTIEYESDILELVKRGATSFHCSEELWRDPLSLSTDLSQEQLGELRIGWDLLIDVDSKYIDYSKIYAEILIDVLRKNGIKNLGIKFSGSKGFHIIVPWKAFPEQMSGKETRLMFPEWPRLICQYLNSQIAIKLRDRVGDMGGTGGSLEMHCLSCASPSQTTYKIILKCPACRTQSESLAEIIKRKRKLRCPNCDIEMTEVRKIPIELCPSCNKTSDKFPNNFKERVKTQHIDADLVLVSSRHLFRAPYSLHEKTSLASVVLDPDKIKDFNITDADPFKVKTRSFIPTSAPGEASFLLTNALEFHPPEKNESQGSEKAKSFLGKKKFKDITINLTTDLYPPVIVTILKGMEKDGRKRALFILLNFFRSLKVSEEEITKIINDWNKKNYEPLKSGYINAQLFWYFKHQPKLPPNYDKSYYKDLGIPPTQAEIKAKNPVSYVIRKSFSINKYKST